MKKIWIVAGLAIVGGTIGNAGVGDWGLQHLLAFAEGGLFATWVMHTQKEGVDK